MRKLFFLYVLIGLMSINTFVYAEDEINFDNSASEQTSENEQISKKEKDPRTIEEKIRAKLHLPPTKRIYFHNIDKSNQPVTEDDYDKFAAEKKRKDFVIPEPDFTREDDIILPEPNFRVIRYNSPPGQRNIDVRKVVSERVVTAPGILSPDKTKMVYTKAFFYPQNMQTSSAAYLIKVPQNAGNVYEILYKTNVMLNLL